MEKPARTPEPPYYAVIFSPVRSGEDPIGYQAMAQTMLELAATMPGYLGVEHGEGINGFAMTVSSRHSTCSRVPSHPIRRRRSRTVRRARSKARQHLKPRKRPAARRRP